MAGGCLRCFPEFSGEKGRLMQINTTGHGVMECSWLPERWQWWAWRPEGMTMGGAATEAEAWEKARAAERATGLQPKGSG